MPETPWFPNDDEHRQPPPPTPEWRERLALNRRNFLKVGLGGLSLSLASAACTTPAAAPTDVGEKIPVEPAVASTPDPAPVEPPVAAPSPAPLAQPAPATALTRRPPILIVVQLSGGNDGLNTVVPYTDDSYVKNRPTLAIKEADVVKLDDRLGLNPALGRFKSGVWDTGKVALLQGVGYPNPNRSHFRSMDIWHTAEPVKLENYGWLGKYMDTALRDAETPFRAIMVGGAAPKALWAKETPAAAIRAIDAFTLRTNQRYEREDRAPLLAAFKDLNTRAFPGDPVLELVNRTWSAATEGARILQDANGKYRSAVQYPNTPFSTSLQLIAGLIQADLGTRVFYTQLGGFDDHAAEKNIHDRLLGQLGDGLNAFWQDIVAQGRADDVLILTFSEFGRRVKENASAGTDHGAAQPLFLIGGRVRGGIYGDHPSLSTLDDGDLIASVDFRAVYNMVFTDWLGVPGRDLLGATYPSLGLISA